MCTSLTFAEIAKIVEDSDRTLADEAEEIARNYHRLGTDLGVWLHAPDDVNWCSFAQWSSKAIGFGLRLDDDSPFWPQFFHSLNVPMVLGAPLRGLVRLLLGSSYGRGLSLANRSIFLELGTLYSNLLCGRGTSDTVLRRQQFVPNELIGPAPDELMQLAAGLYRRAREETDATRRTELIVGANIALSTYEQGRAQPALEFVFYRPIRWLTRVAWRAPFHRLFRRPFNRFAIYAACHEDQPRFVRWLEAKWVRLYCRVLALETAVARVWLSKPLQPLPDRPAPLLEPFTLPEVQALVDCFRPPAAEPALSPDRGVSDWLDYRDRMRFIVGYFLIYGSVPEMNRLAVPDTAARRRRPVATALLGAGRKVAGAGRWVIKRIPIPALIDPSLDAVQAVAIHPAPIVLGAGDAGAQVPCRCESCRAVNDLAERVVAILHEVATVPAEATPAA